MREPLDTPAPHVSTLLTGHFNERRGYACLRRRGTRDWLLILTAGGLGRFGNSHGEWLSRPGNAVLLAPGTRHDYGVERTLEHWELHWVHFHPRPHWLEWLRWPPVAPGLLAVDLKDPVSRRRIVRRFGELHSLSRGHGPRAEALAVNALEEILLRCGESAPPARGRLDPRIEEAVAYLTEHQAEKVSIERLADACGLSASRLAHLFRDQTGTTPQRFLERQRLERARQLLERTALSIKAIAYEVGFENPFYFTLRFKRHAGHSPSAYRQRLQGEQYEKF